MDFVAIAGKVAFSAVKFGHDKTGRLQKFLSLPGKNKLAAHTTEQGDAHAPLSLPDLVTECGLRDTQRLRSGRDTAVLVQSDKHAQMSDIEIESHG